MQYRNIIAVLFFFLANLWFAPVAATGDVITVTMTTEIEVTSTVIVDTVTLTGSPTVTEEPEQIPITTLYPNGTWVDPSHTAPINGTIVPTPTAPTKDEDSSATNYAGSVRVAMGAGAIAAVLAML